LFMAQNYNETPILYLTAGITWRTIKTLPHLV